MLRKQSIDKQTRSARASVHGGLVVKEGFLKKKSSDAPGLYQNRHFVLAGLYLKYYKDDSKVDNPMKGTIDLSSAGAVTQAGSNKFHLEMTGGAAVKFQAVTEQLAKEWVEVLRTCIGTPVGAAAQPSDLLGLQKEIDELRLENAQLREFAPDEGAPPNETNSPAEAGSPEASGGSALAPALARVAVPMDKDAALALVEVLVEGAEVDDDDEPVKYHRLCVLDADLSSSAFGEPSEEAQVRESLAAARALRKKYIGCVDRVHEEATSYKASAKFEQRMEQGITQVLADGKPCFAASRIGFAEYKADYEQLCSIVTDGMVKTLTHGRLMLLENKYELHRHLNANLELREETNTRSTDLYTVQKVSACFGLSGLERASVISATVDEAVQV